MPDATDPNRSGFATSEGKLTLIAILVGTVLEGAVVPVLQQIRDSFPQAAWAAVAMGVAGALIQVATVLGYQRARTQLKLGMLSSDQSTARAG